ncbi:MAG: GNAT family N-acetyltransferase [Candidatus Thorarchaeota archaeon]
MIKRLTTENIDDLDGLIEDFLQFLQEKYGQPAFPLKEQLQDAISQNTRAIFAVYDQDGKTVGMTVGNLASHWITLFYVQNMLNPSGNSKTFIYEKELFEAIFTYLKENFPNVGITRDLSKALGKHIVELGFQRFERAHMSISRSEINELAEPPLPPDFTFTAWNKEMRESLVEILGQSHFNSDHVDGQVFPQFSGVDGVRFLLEGIENSTFGQFKEEFPRVLKHNGKPIGICFLTTLSSNDGYIPEIAILPSCRGKRLGRALIVHSIKHFIEIEPEIPRVDLDVTLDNIPAGALYSSLGFQERQRYFLSVWNRENS